MIRKIVAGILVASLFAIPVLADGEEVGASSLENNNDSQQDITVVVDLDALEVDISDLQSDLESYHDENVENQNVINNNLAFLVASIISCAGLFVGFWTGKDLLDFLWKA